MNPISNRRLRKASILFLGCFGLLLVVSNHAFSLNRSKRPPGADHAAAHVGVPGLYTGRTGLSVPIGVVEVPEDQTTSATTFASSGIDIFLPAPQYHFPGRLLRDRYFVGTVPPLVGLPPLATGSSLHGTLVSDVVASSDPVYTGVASAGHVYAAWINNYNSTRAAVDLYQRTEGVYLSNHSWESGANTNGASQYALFFDWFTSRKDTVCVIAAGNSGDAWGRGDSQIGIPADAHNVITVGAVDHRFRRRVDYSSYLLSTDAGGAALEVRGKPDIVAPGGNYEQHDGTKIDGIENDVPAAAIEMDGTSFAAPHVSGVSAMLVEAGLGLPGPAMRNRLAHKAIILNSARKRHINRPRNGNAVAMDNAATSGEASDGDYLLGGMLRVGGTAGAPKGAHWTPTLWSYPAVGAVFSTFRPLDDELGTGVLDAERALIQHDAGEQGTGLVDPIGWKRNALAPGMPDDVYQIRARIRRGTFITATLTWDRVVDSSDSDLDVEQSDTYANGGGGTPVPDLDLKIYKVPLVGPPVLFAESIGIGGAGTGQNVEHLHVPVDETATYEIHVNFFGAGGGLTNYGLAWWTRVIRGACYHPPPTNYCTIDVTEQTCIDLGGVWTEEGVGCACCTGDMDGSGAIDLGDLPDFVSGLLASPPDRCADVDGDGWANGIDVQLFVNQVLSGWACPPTIIGGCCLPDGSCADTSGETDCEALGGSYYGDDISCADASCLLPGTGACCLTPASCVDGMSYEDCTTAGGSYHGDDFTCAMVSCLPTICITSGTDCWVTPCGPTTYGFGQTPLPPDFFGPGSDPFTGQVMLGGPGQGPLGTDTSVRRLDDLCFQEPLPATDRVPIELLQLNLVSCQPITVTYNSGQNPEAWNVSVGLSTTVPAMPGTMTVIKTHANGGTFDATLFVQPLFIFTNVSNPSQQVVLDTGMMGIDPMLLASTGIPWLHTAPGSLSCSPDFFPGYAEDSQGEPCCVESCHEGPAPDHKHCVRPPECDHCEQACCFPDGSCVDLPTDDCLGQGGTPQGAGTTCATTTCQPSGYCAPPGDDCWMTACGQTRYGFAPTPIPADFFDPGSQPFDGVVYFRGAGVGPFGTDTTVRRLGPLCFPQPLPSTATVPIELVSLNLVSCQPITVTYSGGGTELWNASVGLSPTLPPPGSLTATMSMPTGGTFDAQFYVQPVFIFSKVADPSQVRTLDTGGLVPPMLMTSTGIPWRINSPFPTCSPGFAPGIEEDANGQPCCVESCHEGPSPDHQHCTRPPECNHCQQACCFPDGTCLDLPSGDCLGQGGTPQGSGTTCATTTCQQPGYCAPPGDDCWATTCGQTRYGFSSTPLPADFFDPGSDPFFGTVQLGGAGLGPFGSDTIVRRLGSLCFPPPLPSSATVPLELVSLNLVSCQPINVTYFGGHNPEPWNVSVGLSPTIPPPGSMTVTMNTPTGGTFDAQFYVQPVFIFTKVTDPSQVRTLDTGGFVPPMLMTSTGVPWLINSPFPTCSPGFAPGVQEGPQGPCCEETCHEGPSPDHQHCTTPPECQQCPQAPPNDDCIGALPLAIGTTVIVDNTTATDDPESTANCGTAAVNQAVWYAIVGDGTTLTASTCYPGGTFDDTKLQVWCNDCNNLVCVGGDDDMGAACPIHSLRSQVSWCSAPGQVYYLAVGGYGTNAGIIELGVISDGLPCSTPPSCLPCILPPCPPGAIPESEVCGSDTNGGCNSTPPVFEPISCGVTVCGAAWFDGTTRDTDWYEVYLPQPSILTISLEGEFNSMFGLIEQLVPGIPGCANITGSVSPYALGAPCVPGTVTTACLPAGTYYLFAAPQFATLVTCGVNSNYRLTVTCSPCAACQDFTLTAPGSGASDTCGAGNDCPLRPSEDQVWEVIIPTDGHWTFSLCGSATDWDSFMYLGTVCCDADLGFDDDTCDAPVGLMSKIVMPSLTAGTYYVTIEGYNSTYCGAYTLTVSSP